MVDMQVIWLCSWYPNKVDQFRGDFIQRQAIAVSAYATIDLVHVVFCDRDADEINIVNSRLTEHIFYRTKKSKLTEWKNLFGIHNVFLEQYIQNNGKPHLVHVQVPLPSGMVALWWKHKFQLPYVLTEHYGIYNDDVEDNFKTRNFLFRHYTRKVIRNADRFLPVSKSLGKEVNSMVVQKKYTDVPNVVDTSLFYYAEPAIAAKFRLIHVSNMAPLKNVQGILDAIAEVSKKRNDFECLFVGNRPPDMLAYAEKLGILGKVCIFKNEITYPEVAAEVRNSHAGILFSATESQSCVVLEWLCSGLPVISSGVGGVVELIKNDNGLLVPAGDVTSLSNAIEQVIKNYTFYNRKKISQEAAGLYSFEAVGGEFFKTYQEVVNL